MSSEIDRVHLLASLFASGSGEGAGEGGGSGGIIRGIGDDAAVLDPSCLGRAGPGRPRLVWTVDAQVSGVHFREDLASWEDVGWRSFMAAASDLAAMGAAAWCSLSSLVLAPAVDDEALAALARGQASAAREIGAPVVGGNLSRGSETSITTTLLGSCERPVERRAREGDGLWIAGEVGLAAAGLASLLAGERSPHASPEVERAILAWRRPRARIADGIAMAGIAHGAIDVSDGLARDVSQLATGGSVCAVFEESALEAYVAPCLSGVAARLGRGMLDLALHGGEDYALVAASAGAIPGFTRIGSFARGHAGETLLERGGATRAIAPGGWDHFG